MFGSEGEPSETQETQETQENAAPDVPFEVDGDSSMARVRLRKTKQTFQSGLGWVLDGMSHHFNVTRYQLDPRNHVLRNRFIVLLALVASTCVFIATLVVFLTETRTREYISPTYKGAACTPMQYYSSFGTESNNNVSLQVVFSNIELASPAKCEAEFYRTLESHFNGRGSFPFVEKCAKNDSISSKMDAYIAQTVSGSCALLEGALSSSSVSGIRSWRFNVAGCCYPEDAPCDAPRMWCLDECNLFKHGLDRLLESIESKFDLGSCALQTRSGKENLDWEETKEIFAGFNCTPRMSDPFPSPVALEFELSVNFSDLNPSVLIDRNSLLISISSSIDNDYYFGCRCSVAANTSFAFSDLNTTDLDVTYLMWTHMGYEEKPRFKTSADSQFALKQQTLLETHQAAISCVEPLKHTVCNPWYTRVRPFSCTETYHTYTPTAALSLSASLFMSLMGLFAIAGKFLCSVAARTKQYSMQV